MNRPLSHITCSFAFLLGFASCWAQMLPVKSGRLWGIIDTRGKSIAPAQFDAVSEITARQAVVVLGGKYGLMDSTGQMLIEPRYTFLQRIDDGLVLINQGGDCQTRDCEGGKWGLINLGLQQTLAPAYNLIQDFDAFGLALANVGGRCGYDSCDGGRWGIVNTDAREVLPPQYLKVVVNQRSEAYIQADAGWGLYNLVQQRIMIQPRYDELRRFAPNRVAMRSGKLWGVLNDRGDTLVMPQYQGFLDAGYGYLAYQRNGKFGLMDSLGRERSPARYDLVQMEAHGWIRVKNEGYFGLVDTSGREITRQDLAEIHHFGAASAIVQRQDDFGLLNRQGQELIPVKHDKCQMVNDSLILVSDVGGYLKWFDPRGKLLQALHLDSLSGFSKNKVARGKLKGRWGLINMEGQWVVPAKYDEMVVYLQAAKAREGERIDFFYFNEDGHSSKVKRIVLISDEPEDTTDLLAVNGTSFLGWFLNSSGKWGLRAPTGNRILIEPSFSAVEVVPGTNVTCVKGKIKGSENYAWGLVDHTRGKSLTPFLFETVITADFLTSTYARVVYFGSDKYALLSLKGQTIPFANAAYIGKFIDGVARINLGGQLVWRPEGDIDTILSSASRDRYSNEVVVTYRYCTGGKWGYIDTLGKWLKPAEYDCALDFQDGMARVRIQNKWGAVNNRFEIVVPPQYDFIERLFEAGGKTLFAVGRDKVAFGFIDERGEISIKPQFDEVGEFHGGMVRIRQDKFWGYANRAGDIVIQPQYVDAGDFSEGRARVRNARAWGYIDSLGNHITPQKYLRAGDFREGLAWVQGEKFFGFVDLQGKIAITPAYAAVGDFSEGLAPAKRKGVYGLIDKQGRWVVQPSYYRIGGFRDSLAVVQEMGTFGLIKPTGEFVVKPIYKEIADYSEGLARFRNGMEYGYLDRLGNAVIPSSYSNAGDFACRRASIFVQGKWGFIDTTGAVVVPPMYPKVGDFQEARAAVRVADSWGFIDPSGEVAVPIIYDRVADFQDGRAAVKLESLGWGLVNEEGTAMIKCMYDEIGFRKNGIVSVRMGRKWGLINSYGAQMTPCKYDQIGKFNEGLSSVMLRRSIGIVDDQGHILLDPHYDTVARIGDLMQVEDDDAIGYLDFTGKWIWQPTK
jgi:WG containing repeat